MITLDLTNYRETRSARVREGEHKVQVEFVDVTQSKGGNDMIVLHLRVLEGDDKGALIIDRLTLTERALFRVVNFLQALGMPTQRKRYSINPEKFTNRVVMVTVEDGEPYNGTVKSEVRDYARVPSSADTSAAPQELDTSADEPQPEDATHEAVEAESDLATIPLDGTVDLETVEL